MSYITWRKENEDKFLATINDGAAPPCLKESSSNPLTDEVITPLVDEMLKKEYLNGVTFPILFAEYLFETYHISPVDCEILSQCGMRASLKMAAEASYKAGTMIGEILKKAKGTVDEEEEDVQ